MKYFFNFCHGSRTVGFGISAKARLPARLLCRYVHILDLSSFCMAKSSGSLRPARRTSNYEGGGIGARSVGTCRKDFSVTFWQRWSEESHLPSRRFEGRADVDLCLFATRSRPRTIDTLALGLRLPTTLALEIRGPGFGNIYAVRGTDTQPSPSDRL